MEVPADNETEHASKKSSKQSKTLKKSTMFETMRKGQKVGTAEADEPERDEKSNVINAVVAANETISNDTGSENGTNESVTEQNLLSGEEVEDNLDEDEENGDGLYGKSIPAKAAKNGKMVRDVSKAVERTQEEGCNGSKSRNKEKGGVPVTFDVTYDYVDPEMREMNFLVRNNKKPGEVEAIKFNEFCERNDLKLLHLPSRKVPTGLIDYEKLEPAEKLKYNEVGYHEVGYQFNNATFFFGGTVKKELEYFKNFITTGVELDLLMFALSIVVLYKDDLPRRDLFVFVRVKLSDVVEEGTSESDKQQWESFKSEAAKNGFDDVLIPISKVLVKELCVKDSIKNFMCKSLHSYTKSVKGPLDLCAYASRKLFEDPYKIDPLNVAFTIPAKKQRKKEREQPKQGNIANCLKKSSAGSSSQHAVQVADSTPMETESVEEGGPTLSTVEKVPTLNQFQVDLLAAEIEVGRKILKQNEEHAKVTHRLQQEMLDYKEKMLQEMKKGNGV